MKTRKRKPPESNGAPPDPVERQRQWDSEIVVQWAAHVQERSAAVEKARVQAIEAREAYKQAKRILREREGMLTTALAQPPGTFPLFDRPAQPEVKERMDAATLYNEALARVYGAKIVTQKAWPVQLQTALLERDLESVGDVLELSRRHPGADVFTRVTSLVMQLLGCEPHAADLPARLVIASARIALQDEKILEERWSATVVKVYPEKANA